MYFDQQKIENNTAINSVGGGMVIDTTQYSGVISTTVIRNTGQRGAGIFISSSNYTLVMNSIIK